jgi:hypothetical protein
MTTQTTGGNKNNDHDDHNDDGHNDDDGHHDDIVAMKMAVKDAECVSNILEHLGTSEMLNHTVLSHIPS